MSAWTNYAENQFIDAMRGQTLTIPATWYFALVTAAGDDATAGTEVSTSGTGYARVGMAASLANFAGTQGAGTTVASTGTSGTTSNNNDIVFPAPTANWGVVVGVEVWDASTGGNRWLYGAISPSKTINSGDPAPTFSAGSFTFQFDN